MLLSVRPFVAVAAAVAAVVALLQLHVDTRGIERIPGEVQGTPITVYRAAVSGSPAMEPAPVVVVAHGFAGSQRLMEPFALHLAGRGYVVVTYDFVGHGRHPRPMTGDLGDQEGTPVLLIRQTAEVADHALTLPGVNGRLAVVGHSMATNILVRYAQEDDRVAATVGISMFAPTIDAVSPVNLLAVVGAMEGRLEAEARRVVGLATDLEPEAVRPFQTYGEPGGEGAGARRLAVAPRVEHVTVLFSRTTLRETGDWLDAVFGRTAGATGDPGAERGLARGGWIALLLIAAFILAWPLAGWLPRVGAPHGGASASWRRLAVVAGVPALLTPLLLAFVPTGFLPVVVGDYVAVHFGTFGLMAGLLLWWTGGRPGLRRILERSGLHGRDAGRILGGAALVMAGFLLLLAWPLDRTFTAFFPTPERLSLLFAVLVGTVPYFVTDEWLTRGDAPRRGAYAFTKLLFLLSLGLAVALDFQSLFFLLIIVPVILVFFVVHGLFSGWIFRRTGSPLVAGLGNAMAFAWALAVTFPLYAGP